MKIRTAILAAVTSTLVLTACTPDPKELAREAQAQKQDQEVVAARGADIADTYAQSLTYGRDRRTGLCFAMSMVHMGYSIALVPCDVVKNMLKK